ncbi:MAG: chemotaxis protein CheR [Rhodocyclales bacterium]|nr:chemotaxis protein CheR [Rhodocyclales bacterium]
MLTERQPAREFEFTAADFERIRKLIYEHAGIALSPVKHDMVYSRLARRLRACGDKSFAQYLARLERGDRAEWETFVNALTTNLTSFFREAHHFEVLAKHLAAIREKRPIKIWCCAASTGEEPYSIAMTAVDAFSSFSPPVSILASDLDTSVLAQGSRGVYAEERVAKLPRDLVSRFFQRDAAAPGQLRVRPELQRLVAFRRINLLDASWPVQGPLDAIFCRNVMIYFDKPTQYRILQKFVPLLREDGLLFAGHSESLLHAADLFRPLGRTVYERNDRRR